MRGGIKTVLIPEENAKDLVEITDSIKSGLEIIPVSRMDEVLARALVRKPEPIVWDEATAKPVEVPDGDRGRCLRLDRALARSAADCGNDELRRRPTAPSFLWGRAEPEVARVRRDTTLRNSPR